MTAATLHTFVAYKDEEALRYLLDAKAVQQLPARIILDINMPRLNAKETLVRIKAIPGSGTLL